MKFIVALLSCLLVGAIALRGDDFDDTIPDDATHVAQDVAAWCEVDGHRFVFEKTTLGQIIETLGAGTLERTGNAGAATFEYQVS